MKTLLACVARLAIAVALVSVPLECRAQNPTSSDAAKDVAATLQRQTQELLDAVTAGDAKVWDRYLLPTMTYSDENGDVKGRDQLVKEIQPLPKEIWGKLAVTEFRATVHGDVAVTTYVSDETEGYFGQVLHARYLSTDTWVRQSDGWRLAASAVEALRNDPPAVALPASRLDEYVGVYSLTPTVSYTIRREGDALVGQRTGRKPETLKAEVADVFFVPGQPRLRKVFRRGADGRVAGFVERRETWDIAWERVK